MDVCCKKIKQEDGSGVSVSNVEKSNRVSIDYDLAYPLRPMPRARAVFSPSALQHNRKVLEAHARAVARNPDACPPHPPRLRPPTRQPCETVEVTDCDIE